MKVFLSWSEERSQQVATALNGWLPQIIQSVVPFMSATMDAGVRWNEVVEQELDTHSLGVLCVTSENVARPWLNFEAGALARGLGDKGRLIPYLLDFASPSDLGSPLSQFNAVLADREGTWKLVTTLDGLDERPRSKQELRGVFDNYFWPLLRDQIEPIKASRPEPAPTRSDGDKLDELLEIGRQLLRRSEAPGAGAWTSGTAFTQARVDNTALRLRSPSDPEAVRLIDASGLGRLALQLGLWVQQHPESLTGEIEEAQNADGDGNSDGSSPEAHKE